MHSTPYLNTGSYIINQNCSQGKPTQNLIFLICSAKRSVLTFGKSQAITIKSFNKARFYVILNKQRRPQLCPVLQFWGIALNSMLFSFYRRTNIKSILIYVSKRVTSLYIQCSLTRSLVLMGRISVAICHIGLKSQNNITISFPCLGLRPRLPALFARPVRFAYFPSSGFNFSLMFIYYSLIC